MTERRALKSALIAEQAKAITFSDVAKEYIAKKSGEFKSAKQVYKLTQQIETYAYPTIGRMVVADIERAHIVKLLEPSWTTKHETAGWKGPEYRLVIPRRLAPDETPRRAAGVAALPWNQWQHSRGVGGRLRLKSVAGLVWNTHSSTCYQQWTRLSIAAKPHLC